MPTHTARTGVPSYRFPRVTGENDRSSFFHLNFSIYREKKKKEKKYRNFSSSPFHQNFEKNYLFHPWVKKMIVVRRVGGWCNWTNVIQEIVEKACGCVWPDRERIDRILLCSALLSHRWKNYRVDRCRSTDFIFCFSQDETSLAVCGVGTSSVPVSGKWNRLDNFIENIFNQKQSLFMEF